MRCSFHNTILAGTPPRAGPGPSPPHTTPHLTRCVYVCTHACAPLVVAAVAAVGGFAVPGHRVCAVLARAHTLFHLTVYISSSTISSIAPCHSWHSLARTRARRDFVLNNSQPSPVRRQASSSSSTRTRTRTTLGWVLQMRASLTHALARLAINFGGFKCLCVCMFAAVAHGAGKPTRESDLRRSAPRCRVRGRRVWARAHTHTHVCTCKTRQI